MTFDQPLKCHLARQMGKEEQGSRERGGIRAQLAAVWDSRNPVGSWDNSMHGDH